jgi:hypothetical protein
MASHMQSVRIAAASAKPATRSGAGLFIARRLAYQFTRCGVRRVVVVRYVQFEQVADGIQKGRRCQYQAGAVLGLLGQEFPFVRAFAAINPTDSPVVLIALDLA